MMALHSSGSFALDTVHDCIVAGNSFADLTDADWTVFLNEVELLGRGGRRVNVLVHAQGAGPNAMQRARLNIATKKHDLRMAVMTHSGLARAAILAMGWMAKVAAKPFDPQDIAGALSYLEVPNEQRAQVAAGLLSVRASLGIAVAS